MTSLRQTFIIRIFLGHAFPYLFLSFIVQTHRHGGRSLLYQAMCSFWNAWLHFRLKLSLVMRKPAFCICENKDADQLVASVTAQLISTFVFTKRIVQFLYYLNPKYQASSHLLWLYSSVCVGPGQKSRRPVFSQQGSIYLGVSCPVCLNILICHLFIKLQLCCMVSYLDHIFLNMCRYI